MANFIPSGSGGGGSRESLAERQAKINAACSSFIQIGFCSELFTVNNLHYYGYTEDRFLELIEPISSSITDLDSLRHLFNRARESLYNDPSFTPPDDFFDFVDCVNWMKSDSLARIQMEEVSKADVALARTMVDSAAPLMQEHKRIESEIYALKNHQMELETRFSNINAELQLKLGPMYGYEEPSITELRTDSYRLYEEDCRSKGITPNPRLDEMGLTMVVNVFGGIVKERHLIKFLNDPVRKEFVQTYFKAIAVMGGNGF
ncbi:hypothetical protein KIW84_031380 [Lathyrus oleraceus]|uniref:Uncharacterized protein n=1 Tax=Pisum sativum TaxID=3888 RepID=A0A9D4XS94_PEA|nr:hypothetical protein KIW84_031380 [Pisum sativum]